MLRELAALARLALLELRRALGGVRALGALALAALVLGVDWAPPAALLAAGAEPERLARGLLRQGAWTAIALVAVPALVLRVAGTAGRWRAGEADWLGARPTARTTALVASLAGVGAAGLALLTAGVLGIEARAGAGGARALELVARHEPAASRLVRPWERPVEVDLGPLARAARAGDELRLRVALTLAGGSLLPGEEDHGSRPAGPVAALTWRVARGGSASTVEATVRGRDWLAVEVPGGEGDLAGRLIDRGPAAVVLLRSPGLELWRGGVSEARASLRAAGAALALLLALLPLGLGLGFWMNPATAAALAGSGLLWALAMQEAWRAPGRGLLEALAVLGEGRVPGAVPGEEWAAAAGCALLGLGLARAGCRSWRHGR